jgi:hypothetical protein
MLHAASVSFYWFDPVLVNHSKSERQMYSGESEFVIYLTKKCHINFNSCYAVSIRLIKLKDDGCMIFIYDGM